MGTKEVAMSSEERATARECAKLLAPYGKTARDATEHFLVHLKSSNVVFPSLGW